jgi:DNA-3-methyladenine glycosylase II
MRGADDATRHLRAADPRMAAIVERVGRLALRRQRCTPFESLARAIVYQQLSGKAAATIYGRVAAACGGEPTPDSVRAVPDRALREAGLSGQKLSYLRDLSSRVASGKLDLARISRHRDEAIVEQLVAVKGIGRWSAEMFLIFRLNRPDVLPVGDLGIRKAVQRAYGLRKLPEADRIAKIAEPWRPWRTAATWYLWRSLDQEGII